MSKFSTNRCNFLFQPSPKFPFFAPFLLWWNVRNLNSQYKKISRRFALSKGQCYPPLPCGGGGGRSSPPCHSERTWGISNLSTKRFLVASLRRNDNIIVFSPPQGRGRGWVFCGGTGRASAKERLSPFKRCLKSIQTRNEKEMDGNKKAVLDTF